MLTLPRIAGFDRDHPNFHVGVQLKDGRVKIPVLFTEEFDDIAVLAPKVTMAADHLRTYPLFKSRKCDIYLVIPKGQTQAAAQTCAYHKAICAK